VDFDSLSQELEVHRSLYESTIGPIRNNVAAHSGPITEEEMRDLFANVQMVDFDRLVVFPLVLNNEMCRDGRAADSARGGRRDAG
jgi:hypothetical protein